MPRPPSVLRVLCSFSVGGVCTESSRSRRAVPPALAEITECIRDAELSACYTAASSRRACTSLCRLRPSGVEGSCMARSRIAAAVIFWLALFKAGWFSTAPSSARIRSRAMRPASRAPAPRTTCSCSSVARSSCVCGRSSWSLASSSWSCSSCACCSL